MRAATSTLLAFLFTALLAGCSSFKFPGVHKIDVQQGNIITQEMVNQLKPGMSRSQVRYVMGTPLIVDTFNQDRWDYFYSLVDKDENEVREKVSIYFQDNKLVGIKGDYVPVSASTNPLESAESAESAETVE